MTDNGTATSLFRVLDTDGKLLIYPCSKDESLDRMRSGLTSAIYGDCKVELSYETYATFLVETQRCCKTGQFRYPINKEEVHDGDIFAIKTYENSSWCMRPDETLLNMFVVSIGYEKYRWHFDARRDVEDCPYSDIDDDAFTITTTFGDIYIEADPTQVRFAICRPIEDYRDDMNHLKEEIDQLVRFYESSRVYLYKAGMQIPAFAESRNRWLSENAVVVDEMD